MEFPVNPQFGPKMMALPERERRFVWFYVTADEENGAEAARNAGYSDIAEGAKVRACELMHRERVRDAIFELSRAQFGCLLPMAVRATRRLLAREDHPDHAGMVKSALSRLGLAERSGLDLNVSGEVTVNHTDQALESLRTLIGLGVPREKLIETFGFSGLTRYERMLAELEARAPKLIEGQATEIQVDG